MMQVEGVEVRPSLIGAKVAERGLAVDGKDIQTGNDVRVAGFQAEVGRLLQRSHFAAGVSPKFLDVSLVPRLERLDLPLPAVRHFPVEGMDVPQIEREMHPDRKSVV